MNSKMGQSVSLWKKESSSQAQPSHKGESTSTEVVVVGAGIAGVTTAYLLQRAGRQVTLLERYDLAAGETGRTTAQFATSIDDRYFELEKMHGAEVSKLAAESQVEAIELAERLIKNEKIECHSGRVPGYLFLAPEHKFSHLEKEQTAAQNAGLPVTFTEPVIPALSKELWLEFPNQLELHPVLYLRGLIKAFEEKGGVFRTFTPMRNAEWKKEDQVEVELASGEKISAKYLVTATNTPVIDRYEMHTKQGAYRTYVVAFEVPSGRVPKAFYWDTAEAYHYVRTERKNSEWDYLIVGGEDHKTGQEDHPEKCWKALEDWTREKFPEAKEIAYRWSGQVMEPADALPYAGRNPMDSPNSFIITGDSGNGMTNATIGAKIVSDLILGERNRFEEIYAPNRKASGNLTEYLRENLNVAAQYADYLKTSEVSSADDIKPGEGAILKKHGVPFAVARCEKGELKTCSAICPHLGAVLRWNPSEKSWDCPAHGSRFDVDGKVLNGPCIIDIEKAPTPA